MKKPRVGELCLKLEIFMCTADDRNYPINGIISRGVVAKSRVRMAIFIVIVATGC